jgi:hypothetical protein
VQLVGISILNPFGAPVAAALSGEGAYRCSSVRSAVAANRPTVTSDRPYPRKSRPCLLLPRQSSSVCNLESRQFHGTILRQTILTISRRVSAEQSHSCRGVIYNCTIDDVLCYDAVKMEAVCLSETLVSIYAASHPRETTSLSSPPWELKISQLHCCYANVPHGGGNVHQAPHLQFPTKECKITLRKSFQLTVRPMLIYY